MGKRNVDVSSCAWWKQTVGLAGSVMRGVGGEATETFEEKCPVGRQEHMSASPLGIFVYIT